MVASCKLPLGRPNFNLLLIVRAHSETENTEHGFTLIAVLHSQIAL
jgi:hypothetical protein